MPSISVVSSNIRCFVPGPDAQLRHDGDDVAIVFIGAKQFDVAY